MLTADKQTNNQFKAAQRRKQNSILLYGCVVRVKKFYQSFFFLFER